MNTKLASIFLVTGAMLLPVAGCMTNRSADGDTDRSSPKAFVKDSVITTKVKALLAKEKPATLVHVSVDTDKNGIVSLGGTAATQSAADKAVMIARAVEGVTSVDSHIRIVADK
jgi:hyperosmotically inducible protein